MNRKQRRAALKRHDLFGGGAPVDERDAALPVADLLTKARWHHQNAQPDAAREICNRILAREPTHVPALNLVGLILQESGRHKLAIKSFAAAIASDPLNAACHYNIATSYQALARPDEATDHFKKALGLGMSRKNAESFIFQNPAITACINRIDDRWPLPVASDEAFAGGLLDAIARDVFLRCALETILIRTDALERFLTFLRGALLRAAEAAAADGTQADDAIVRLASAMAQQCFINEYVFAQTDDETRRANVLKDALRQKLADGADIPPLLLAAVAAYLPLHALPQVRDLLSRQRPDSTAGLVHRQVIEPLEEAEDRAAFSALTTVDDAVSREVMAQYAENPYPRWTVNPLAVLAGEREMGIAANDDSYVGQDILIAGCGSGQHALQAAQYFPNARVLAVDVSLPSLAYARRKTRELGVHNIEYAQADILKLATLGRCFHRIEAVGVLHHLADPEAGWRSLLSQLRPEGTMRVGLYSEMARREVIELRAFIAARGYRPTTEDIRKCRQEIMRVYEQRRWKSVIDTGDFYSTSGCRDLLFNVMEHRFTIPRIEALLDEQRLSFLGFELEEWIIDKFKQQFPGDAATLDLANWHAFETANPQTFRHMYVFTVSKSPPDSSAQATADRAPGDARA